MNKVMNQLMDHLIVIKFIPMSLMENMCKFSRGVLNKFMIRLMVLLLIPKRAVVVLVSGLGRIHIV